MDIPNSSADDVPSESTNVPETNNKDDGEPQEKVMDVIGNGQLIKKVVILRLVQFACESFNSFGSCDLDIGRRRFISTATARWPV